MIFRELSKILDRMTIYFVSFLKDYHQIGQDFMIKKMTKKILLMCSGNLQKAPLSRFFLCCTWKTSHMLVYAITIFIVAVQNNRVEVTLSPIQQEPILQFCVKLNTQRQMHLYFSKTWDPPLFALSPLSTLTIFQLKKLYIHLYFREKKIPGES